MDYQLLKSLYYQDVGEYERSYNERFNSPSTIHFDFDVHGQPAFALITPEIMLLSQKIYQKSNEINRFISILPDESLEQLVSHLLVEELRLSNEIEGVHSTRKELAEAFSEVRQNKRAKRFNGLIKKYRLLLIREQIPLKTCEDIRKLYDEFTLDEVLREDKNNAPDGIIFRKDGVDVKSETQKVLHKGITPEANIILTMTKALNMLCDEKIPALIRVAVFHYMFGYIHPFYDGNGRMNRFITSYFLAEDFNLITAISLSCTIKKDKNRYYKAFDFTNNEKNKGELTGYIVSFLEIIDEAGTDVKLSLNEKLDKYRFFMKKLSAFDDLPHSSILIKLLISTLFGQRGLTITEIAESTGLALGTVRTAIKNLIEKTGIIRTEKSANAKVYDLDLDLLSAK